MFHNHFIFHVVKQSIRAKDDNVTLLDSKWRRLGRFWATVQYQHMQYHLSVHTPQ